LTAVQRKDTDCRYCGPRGSHSLNEYSKRFIFEPLELKQSAWRLSDIDTTRHSRLYNRQGDMLINVPWYGLVTYSDGGVRTSIADLSEILLCMVNYGKGKQILKPAINYGVYPPY
jgi:hypothetical protein